MLTSVFTETALQRHTCKISGWLLLLTSARPCAVARSLHVCDCN